MMMLDDVLKRERLRKKAERTLRQIRLRIYDYDDAGKLDKAHKVIRLLKVRINANEKPDNRDRFGMSNEDYIVLRSNNVCLADLM